MIILSMEALIDSETLIANMSRRGNELPSKLQKLVTESSMITQGNIQDETPVRTGNAQSSIRRENLGLFQARVFADLGIAPYVEWLISGTDPYTYDIWAKPGSALNTPYGLFKRVTINHPGISANPFFDIGIQNSKSDIDAEIESFTSWLTGESDDY